jgi:hypothetical protein
MQNALENKTIQILEELGFICDSGSSGLQRFKKQISCLDIEAEMIYSHTPYTSSRQESYLKIRIKGNGQGMYINDWLEISKEKIEEVYTFYSFISHLIYYLFDSVFSINFAFSGFEISKDMIQLDVIYAESNAQELIILYDSVEKNIKCFMYVSELHDFSKSVHVTYDEVMEKDHNKLAQEKVKNIHKMIVKSVQDQV